MRRSGKKNKFHYYCDKCRYEAMVIGEPAEDFISYLETRLCLDCQSIVDVPIKFKATAYIGGDPGFREHRIENQCPDCYSTNVEEWDENHSCPKCATPMNIQQ
jgi:hypothetical protein